MLIALRDQKQMSVITARHARRTSTTVFRLTDRGLRTLQAAHKGKEKSVAIRNGFSMPENSPEVIRENGVLHSNKLMGRGAFWVWNPILLSLRFFPLCRGDQGEEDREIVSHPIFHKQLDFSQRRVTIGTIHGSSPYGWAPFVLKRARVN